MVISKEEAKQLVLDYVSQLDLLNWRYQLIGINSKSRDMWWGAGFEVYSPEGTLVDGPVIYLIHKVTGEITTIEGAITQGKELDV